MMRCLWCIFLLMGLAACSSPMLDDEATVIKPGLEPSRKVKVYNYAPADVLSQFEMPENAPFRLGPGDKISLKSVTRPELNSTQIIGPDGAVTVPVIGTSRIGLKTREEAEQQINQSLLTFYKLPSLQLTVDEYNSNRVIVLGRVEKPGVIRFDSPPTLLEALARAGALPVLDKNALLSRCAIFRGRNAIIWVDLKSLLAGGDMRSNIRLRSDDLIYIPDSDDTLVYVLGEVTKPGAYRLTPDMAFLDALSTAGGPTREANGSEITLFRGSKALLQQVPFDQLIKKDPRLNVALEEGDVIYVPRSGVSKVGAFLQQITPGIGLFLLLTGSSN